jgi:hypothetical protein
MILCRETNSGIGNESGHRNAEQQLARLTPVADMLFGSVDPLPGAVPWSLRLGLRTQAPECQTRVRDSNHTARPLCLGVEVGVPQEAPDERSDFILPDAHQHYAVAWVPKARPKKVAVPREKGDIAVVSTEPQSPGPSGPFGQSRGQFALPPTSMPEAAGAVHQGCSHQGRSSRRSFKHVFRRCVLFGMIAKCLAGQ